MRAIRVKQNGGPEALELADVPTPTPDAGEVRVKIEAIGVNFVEVYHRKGLYESPLPYTPGGELAGVVDAVGPDVTTFARGDRVASAHGRGAYAEATVLPAATLVKLPAGLSFELAAAVLLQGMTAHYLAIDIGALGPGRTCLVHAAAGGVGLLLSQLAKRAGARAIGTVSTEAKAKRALAAGCDAVIRYTEEDFVERGKALTGGAGFDVIFDSVGKDTFLRGFDVLRPRGTMVLYGQSSGPVAPFDPQLLNKKGSVFLTRPSLHHYVHDREELDRRAADVLSLVQRGALDVRIEAVLPLAQAAEAHRRLEARETSGKIVMKP